MKRGCCSTKERRSTRSIAPWWISDSPSARSRSSTRWGSTLPGNPGPSCSTRSASASRHPSPCSAWSPPDGSAERERRASIVRRQRQEERRRPVRVRAPADGSPTHRGTGRRDPATLRAGHGQRSRPLFSGRHPPDSPRRRRWRRLRYWIPAVSRWSVPLRGLVGAGASRSGPHRSECRPRAQVRACAAPDGDGARGPPFLSGAGPSTDALSVRRSRALVTG